MAMVEEFWIINWDGISIFNYSPTKDLEPNLVGGFFSAIQSFANEMSRGSKKNYINSITVGDHNFVFLINNDYRLYLICKSSREINEKLLKEHLKKIEQQFVERYDEELKNFDGEIDAFESFESQFSKYFDDHFTNLKGMW